MEVLVDLVKGGKSAFRDTNLSVGTRTDTTMIIESSTGSDVTVPAVSSTQAGLATPQMLASVITIGTTPPSSPFVGQLWLDTN